MFANEQSGVPPGLQHAYSSGERALLLDLARRALSERAAGRQFEPDSQGIPEKFLEPRACFVTLFRHGELRGCIGQVRPQMPLYRAVAHNACAAGFHDTRFEPVGPKEVPELTIEISVLSPPSTISGTPEEILGQLRPHIDGVLIDYSGSMVTFLPQVWEKLSDRTQFMERLCQKAGWDRSCWRSPQAIVSVYQVESFESAEHE